MNSTSRSKIPGESTTLFVLINSNYFSITTKSPIVKEASTKINENITDDEINELKRFLYKSENFIDQTQFVKYFANIEKNQKINNFIDIENLDVKNKLPITIIAAFIFLLAFFIF